MSVACLLIPPTEGDNVLVFVFLTALAEFDGMLHVGHAKIA
jgi:hypothetical protein